MDFKIKIAELNIGIHSVYNLVAKICKDYYSEEDTCAFQIQSSADDIATEKSDAVRLASMNGDVVGNTSLPYLETLVVYRKIAESALDFDTFLMHGAVIARDNFCFMITGPSGTGKTTRTNIILENFPDAYVVNGDKPLLRVVEDIVYACGTPWCGKERMNTNTCVKLKAVFVLERSENNRVSELNGREAFTHLLHQTYKPKESDKLIKTIQLLKILCKRVRVYKLESNREPEVAELICRTAFGWPEDSEG